MPGIVGIIGANPEKDNASRLNRMLGCMLHDPAYISGTYVNEKLGIWVGWVNHPGSYTDCMPVWNETRDICLIFSGEHFSDRSDFDRLRSLGHDFDASNATCLVHLYEDLGPKFFERLNGRFSGLLIDIRRNSTILFNDRYGADRIYISTKPGGLFFSSEAKSILNVLPEHRRIDTAGLAETFSCGCALQNRTLFSGVELLPAASMWTLDSRGSASKARYFHPQVWETQPVLSEGEFYRELRNVFPRILPRYFQGRSRVGMSLTGGLDGRMIMAWADIASGAMPCYTFGGTYRDCTDVRIARQIAKVCNQSHETIVVGDEFLGGFAGLAEKSVYVSDGAMDVTGAVELYVNSIARKIAPVRLTGNYGSEIVRGNVAFKPHSMDDALLDPELSQLVESASATYREERAGPRLSFIAFKQVPWFHYSRLAVELSQLTMRTPYLDNEIVELMYRAPEQAVLSKDPSFRLIQEGKGNLARIPTDRGLVYPAIPVLTRLRHIYEEVTFKAEYEFDYGMPQWLAKIDHRLAAVRPEKFFLGRHKFHHFRVWYRDRLSRYLKEMLLDTRTLSRPYLNRRRMEAIVHEHTSGVRNHTTEIHRVLTSELIQRTLIEQTA